MLGDLKTAGGMGLESEEEPSFDEDFFLWGCLLDDGRNGFEGDEEG